MASLRPRGADDLGLRRALSDRLLPLLVGCMVFLASLAGAGSLAASRMAGHWRGAGEATIVQVPDPDLAVAGHLRADLVYGVLGPGARRFAASEVTALLRPWLGEAILHPSVALPAVFSVQGRLPAFMQASLAQVAPGTLVARQSAWQDRLALLAGSLQACAALALGVVAVVAAAVVAIATRAGLAARRDSIEIVHGLGATDGMIAGRFAARVAALAFAGAVLGALAAACVLLGLAGLAAPLQPGLPADGAILAPAGAGITLASLPGALWGLLAALPFVAGAIGWATAQATVRNWLARLA